MLILPFLDSKTNLEIAEEMWKASAEEEALKVHARVREIIEKKEETIFKLLRYCDQATEKCQHLETLLERQTMQNYLGPKAVKLSNKLGRKYSLDKGGVRTGSLGSSEPMDFQNLC